MIMNRHIQVADGHTNVKYNNSLMVGEVSFLSNELEYDLILLNYPNM